ncbi:limbin isoform X4 [Pleurodeles waltl]|uniref:limbin isoform X4 n=1 Tax=Pleurodeles waltl TaxID=8319 RepID=UPI003709C3CF
MIGAALPRTPRPERAPTGRRALLPWCALLFAPHLLALVAFLCSSSEKDSPGTCSKWTSGTTEHPTRASQCLHLGVMRAHARRARWGHLDFLQHQGSPASLGRALQVATWTDAAPIRCQVFRCKQWTQEEINCIHLGGRGDASKVLHIPLTSAASESPWSHSLFSNIPFWAKKIFKRESIINSQPRVDTIRTLTSDHGLTFEKCAVVNTQNDPQTASVNLKTSNRNTTPSASSVSDLIIRDDIAGFSIVDSDGSNTKDGYQTFRRAILAVGDSFVINYTAALNTTAYQNGKHMSLPAQLSFSRSSQGTQRISLETFFNITVQENPKVSPNHGLHGAGFAIAFFASLFLTCITSIVIFQCRERTFCVSNEISENSSTPQRKVQESSHLDVSDSKIEDVLKSDPLLDILAFEETEKMLQALEDSETAHMTQADAHLESCRIHISRDVIAILLRNMAFNKNISQHVEKRLQDSIKEKCSKMEVSLHEEYERKMVALTAECNLETRKEMEMQHHRQTVSKEESDEFTRSMGEKSAAEFRALVDKLHEKEQHQMKRLLLLKQEEDFAKAHRQLVISQRTLQHEIFFKQAQDSVSKKELNVYAARSLVQHYSEVQEKTEDLMDFLGANMKYHLNKRFACRKYLIFKLQLSEKQSRCLLNTAAIQIANLINKMQSAGHVTEHNSGVLLDNAQTEVHSVKQNLDSSLKNEKRKLHQKMIIKRKRLMLQKLKEQRKEIVSVQDTLRTTRDVDHYLNCWRKVFTDHSLELEELVEKLDNDATEELKALKCSLTDKATDNLRSIQNVVIMQALLKVSVPRFPLQQVLEEHRKELVLCTQQLEKEDEKDAEAKALLESTKKKLNEDLKLNVIEQKSLRNWEQLVFQKVIGLPLALSEEELVKLRQEFCCSFSQMDSSLALPMARTRLMLQLSQSEWRKRELEKVDQYVSAHDKQQVNQKTKKKPIQHNKLDVMKKSVEDTIRVYDENITDDQNKQVRRNLLLERVQQLKTQEVKLGEFIASLQYQKTVENSKALEIHNAVINLQALVIEELCASQTLTVSECTQILEEYSHKSAVLYRKLESEELQKELTQSQDYVMKKQRSTTEGLEIYNEVDQDADRQTTALLRQALQKCKQIVEHQKERLHEEELSSALKEDQLEKLEIESLDALHNQELRMVSYLTKRAKIPVEMIYKVLNLLLPSSSEQEILSVLNSIFHKYSNGNTEPDDSGEETDVCRKSKSQESWKALETRVRQSLINQGLEKTHSTIKRKGSILKKKRLMPVKRVSFSHFEALSKLPPVEPHGIPKNTVNVTGEEADCTDTVEKLFVFRLPTDSTLPSQKNKKKKKRNFLNFKKSSIGFVED